MFYFTLKMFKIISAAETTVLQNYFSDIEHVGKYSRDANKPLK